jgi:nitrogen fixation-related uncharacterized protein
MATVYWLIWGAVAAAGASAVIALAWAVRDGQLRDSATAARSIFDAGEPVGVVTDAFPGVHLERDDMPGLPREST